MKYIFAIWILVLSLYSNAELSVKTYLTFKDEPFAKSYVWGMARGMLWVNTINHEKGGELLFCEPLGYVLSEDKMVELLDTEIRIGQKNLTINDSMPIELVFLVALEKTFPCPKN